MHVMNVTDLHGQEVQVKFFAHDLAAPAAVIEKFCDHHHFQPLETCEADIMRAFTPDLNRLRAYLATGSRSPVLVEGAGQQPLLPQPQPLQEQQLPQQALPPPHTNHSSPHKKLVHVMNMTNPHGEEVQEFFAYNQSTVGNGGPLMGPPSADILERERQDTELPGSYDGIQLDVPVEALIQTLSESHAQVMVSEASRPGLA